MIQKYFKKKIRIKIINFFKFIINEFPNYSTLLYNISRFFPFNKVIKVYKFEYFSNLPGYKIIVNAKQTENYSFIDIDTDTHHSVEKNLKGIGYVEVYHCSVIAGSEFLFKNSIAYIQNYSFKSHINNFKIANFKGSIDNNEHCILTRKINVAKKQLNKVIYLSGTYDQNWYHWLIEILPKLFLIKEKIKKYEDYEVVISENIFNSSTHLESLKLFTSINKIITIDPRYLYEAKQVVFIESASISNRARKRMFNHSLMDGNFHSSIVKSYKRYIEKKLIKQKSSNPERIYLYRNQNKRKFNQKEIIGTLKKYDFEVIDLLKLSFKEQVQLFYDSKIIVGVTGAAWTNITFCQRSAIGLLFCPSSVKWSSAFANLASLSDMKLYQQDLKIPEDHWQAYMKSNKEASVDIKQLENNLKKIMY